MNQQEHLEQSSFFEWCETYKGQYPVLGWFFAVPNGGHRSPAVAGKLKAEGVKRGVLDVFNLTRIGSPEVLGCGLILEFKSQKGKLTAEQSEWGLYLTKQGYQVMTIRSWIDAAKATIDYFGLPHSLKAQL